jgi:small conductance mechanosensitive channel
MENLNVLTSLKQGILNYASKLILAVFVQIVGFWIIKKLQKIIKSTLNNTSFTPEIIGFLSSIINIGLKILLLFSIAEILGIETASFVVVLAVASFAIGLALQGSLGNFAAGIVILLFKPYRVGDWVEIRDKFGKVEEIQIFNTILITPGQKILIIPNGQVISGVVTNFSSIGFIRIELEIQMPYFEDYPRESEIILNELNQMNKVLKDPSPEIGIDKFDSHLTALSVRPYVIPDNYWGWI